MLTKVEKDDIKVIILAGGSGTRANLDLPKQLYELKDGRRVLDLALQAYESIDGIAEIVVVYNEKYKSIFVETCGKYGKIHQIVKGGVTRQESLARGLIKDGKGFVLIHDSARPIVHKPAVVECVKKLRSGSRAVHTVFHSYVSMIFVKDNQVREVIDRNDIVYPQCPIGFCKDDLVKALLCAIAKKKDFRDDLSLVRYYDPNFEICLVDGHQSGFKITYPEDMRRLELYLGKEE